MKYMYLLLAVAALAVAGCRSNDNGMNNNNGMTNSMDSMTNSMPMNGMTNGQTKTMPPN